ncbi:hypothetical protein BFS35_013255, partial [Macrococcoides goetzii]
MKKHDFLPNKLNKYSIRKFTVGTASILVGSLIFLGNSAEAAEDSKTETPTTETPTTEGSTETVTTEAPTTEHVTSESVLPEKAVNLEFNADNTELTVFATAGQVVELTLADGTVEKTVVDTDGTFTFHRLAVKSGEVVKVVTVDGEHKSEAVEVSANTVEVTIEAPTTEAVTTKSVTTEEVTSETASTETPTTEEKTTESATTEAPSTENTISEDTTTEVPTTENVTTETSNSDVVTVEETVTPNIDIEATATAVNTASTVAEKEQTLTESLQASGVSEAVAEETVSNLSLDNTDVSQEALFAALLNAVATDQDANTPVATPVTLTTNTSMMRSITLGNMEVMNTLASSSTNNLVTINSAIITDAGYDNPLQEDNDNVIKPHSAEPIKYNANFLIDNSAKSGDTFNLSFSDNLTPSDLTPDNYVVSPILDASGQVVANGIYNHQNKTITYTFTDYVDTYENVTANVSLSGYIDKSVVQNNSTQTLAIDLDGEITQFTGQVEYGNPIGSPSSNIESIYTHLDEVNHTIEQVFYINPLNNVANNTIVNIYGARKDANGNLLQEGSPYIDETTQIEIYSAGNTVNLPESMYINDYNQYTDVTSSFYGKYKTYGSDQVELDFGNINSAFIIRIVSQYDPNSVLPILQGASMISESPLDNMIYTVETSNNIDRVNQSNSGDGTTTTYKIGDYVWEDTNKDGIQESTETGIADVLVTLQYPDGTQKSVRTDSTGHYEFTGLIDGETYNVTFETPTGYTATNTTEGTTESTGSNPDLNTITINGADNLTIDKGYISNAASEPTYSLGNFTWFDMNNNGLQDDLSPDDINGDGQFNDVTPYEGVIVRIYDAATNLPVKNQFDEDMVVISDANGHYQFDGLKNGDYIVEFEVPEIPGMIKGQDNHDAGTNDEIDSDGVREGTTNIFRTTATINNADNMTVDMAVAPEVYNVGDRIWNDTDKDGIQDATEKNYTGTVTVKLVDVNGNPVTHFDGTPVENIMTTDGTYEFTNIIPGDYKVIFELPAGITISPNDTTTDEVDSDGILVDTNTPNIVEAPVSVVDHDVQTVDLGVVLPEPTYTLGDKVFEDMNHDGIQDTNEPGIPGVTVTLTKPDGTTVTTTTDNNGNYSFTELPTGNYTVTFDTPATYVPVTPNQGADDFKDSDPTPNRTNTQSTVTVNLTDNNPTIDAGFEKAIYKIGDHVWQDNNNNDIQDAGDTGIAGVTVTLKDATGKVIATQTTDANGNYLFEGLSNGDYTVEFGTPADTKLVPVKEHVGTSDVDSDLSVVPVTINNGDNLTIDRGFEVPPVPSPTYKIGDRVWQDNNNNDIQDAGDTGIAGVTVTLKDATGKVIATQSTDANGNYLFEGLLNGDYTVEFGTPADTKLVPVKEHVGTSDVDSDLSVVPVTINNGDNLTIDRGFEVPPVPSPTYKIGDRVWQDNNNNDIQDAGDTRIAGVTVTLKDATGKVIATQTTDANGNYLFEWLLNGDYTVEFGTPADTKLVPVKEHVGTSDVDSDLSVVPVTINNGDNLTIDRGFEVPPVPSPTYKIGDRVWQDNNNN